MKKIFSLAAISFFALSNAALAKTEGSYIGIDAIYTQTTFYETAINSGDVVTAKPSTSHGTKGIGLNYKYAFNFDGFFIAPGAILEQNSFGASGTNSTDQRFLQTRNRYGVKADFGYDVTNLVAPYVTIGYGGINYRSRDNGVDGSNNLIIQNKSGNSFSPFYGAGLKFNCSKNISINLEYNYQSFRTKNTVPSQSSFYLSKSQYHTRLDVMKVGISYNF